MSVFGAHSTKGAGVSFYKRMGLSSEIVCEIGQWKNVTAFSAHYLRLNAADTVTQHFSLPPEVHKVSPVECVDSEGSCTPRQHNLGGSDPEEDTQNTGEPDPPCPKTSATFSNTNTFKRKATHSPKRPKKNGSKLPPYQKMPPFQRCGNM